MRLRRIVLGLLVLLAAWSALAAWQYHEYGHERQLARRTLERQGETVMNLLTEAIRSHRRLGRFFEEQIQGIVDGAAQTEDILAVAIVSDSGQMLLAAGQTELLEPGTLVTARESWTPAGFELVGGFELDQPSAPRALGGGPGGGRGFGRRWADEQDSGPFSEGGRYTAALLLDRTNTDNFCRRAFWLRAGMVAAGVIVILCVGIAWMATVRMVEARGRTRLLDAERRHFRDLSQAAAGLAHETRNPLSLIRGWTQRLAQSDSASDEQRSQAHAIVEECDRVTARVNQFLAFAKPCQPAMESIDPIKVIRELQVLLEPDLEAKHLSIAYAEGPDSVTIRADRELFRQAIFNLLSNAVQFSPESETVEIKVLVGQDKVLRFEVADRGPGVPSDKVERLFTPYFTTRSDGTGLGLAIVRRIAAAHAWDSGYAPRPDGGSIFWLEASVGPSPE
jgi:signal transduction histidine kinase